MSDAANEWGLMQSPAAPAASGNTTNGAVEGGLAGAAIGAVIGYLMKPRLVSVIIPTVLLGAMGGTVGYLVEKKAVTA